MYKIKFNDYYVASWRLTGGINPMNVLAVSGDKLLKSEEHDIKLIANSKMAHLFEEDEANKFIELFGGTLMKIVEEQATSTLDTTD